MAIGKLSGFSLPFLVVVLVGYLAATLAAWSLSSLCEMIRERNSRYPYGKHQHH
jgi:hypothetical protein